ncbi:MAG: hypothetical protein HOK23_04380 [Euryarchaeota archaeon]|nr:hypothetical protein [Euryarchaeota archaeon]
MNNTTVEITTNYYTNETSTTTNNVNGSGGVSTSSLHALSGTDPGESSLDISYGEYDTDLALLVREDAFSAATAGNSASALNGVNICVGIGTITEGNLVDWFSQRGIAFTSVPVADTAEATAKFIDGSCDAMPGPLTLLQDMKIQLVGDGSMGGVDIWITNPMIGTSVSTFDFSRSGWSVLNLTIEQEFGASSYLLTVHSEITLTGTCISNCTDQSAVILQTYVFSTERFEANYSTSSGGIDFSNTCEGLTNLDSWPGYFGPPGLECELDMTMFASLSTANWREYDFTSYEDYEFAWSDWSYYVLWQSTAVTMHE